MTNNFSMVKVKSIKVPINTYSKKKGTSKSTKIAVNFVTNVYQINNTTNTTNIYFSSNSKSESSDAFDKLLKGTSYAPKQTSSVSETSRKYFKTRQETFSFYNSDTTSSSSPSSVRLFKDFSKESHSVYSPFNLPFNVTNEIRKKKIVKKNSDRVHKRKPKKVRKDISPRVTGLSATSSTPTNPNIVRSGNIWIESHVSPIVPVLPYCSPKIPSLSDSSNDIFSIKANGRDINIPKPRLTLGLSGLLEGFSKLNVNTPHPNRCMTALLEHFDKLKVNTPPQNLGLTPLLHGFDHLKVSTPKTTHPNVKKVIEDSETRNNDKENYKSTCSLENVSNKKNNDNVLQHEFLDAACLVEADNLLDISRRRSKRTRTALAKKKLSTTDSFISISENDLKNKSLELFENEVKVKLDNEIEEKESRTCLEDYVRPELTVTGLENQRNTDDLNCDNQSKRVPYLETPNSSKELDFIKRVSNTVQSRLNSQIMNSYVRKNLNTTDMEKIKSVRLPNSQKNQSCVPQIEDSYSSHTLSLVPGKQWRRSFLRLKQTEIQLEASADCLKTPESNNKTIDSQQESEEEVDEEDISFLLQNPKEDEFHKIGGEMGVLSRCGLQRKLQFSEVFTDEILTNCRKIGEGVYGEVYMLEPSASGKSVVKIIPVEGSQLVNNEPQKHFDEVLSELIISEELSLLKKGSQNQTSGFCELKNKFCLKGKYPKILIDLWHQFDQEKGSDNDCPDMFEDQQLYIVLELGHGGEPIESFHFTSAKQAYSVFLQTAFTLAVAEASVNFEHRDLHIGNVLVANTSEDYVPYIINGFAFELPTYGLKATIIDFTLSRISFKDDVLYYDMSQDPELFTAEGDYQFEIYRLMRKDLDDKWSDHAPVTNIRWLHYLVDKFVTKIKYRNKKAKSHLIYKKKLVAIEGLVLDFLSSFDFAEFLLHTYTSTIPIIKK